MFLRKNLCGHFHFIENEKLQIWNLPNFCLIKRLKKDSISYIFIWRICQKVVSFLSISNDKETELDETPIFKKIQIAILKMRFLTLVMDAAESIAIGLKTETN